ncbi:hypothetical protein HCBG_06580 [Histoplasma capsulatum G186AR]|uniref:Uncharacterized protein n=2 Tax=Ajellomyces capsulatus TaxID=5037 RepID=C0NTV0_AJECG|nr:uncharacterized protein HCBG_06580 [Histoplasma capsulatum G186AR]EEH05461.1 hypothetical protein HCBG_06580 [Histoplasma capsulatum G186AR]KAG5305169.1 hypothetical protein I7I52_03741 [Histoplasma capsulatum]QSS76129.1 hypothetical protein I7I50_05480 [Histoplasma capsulatum G186AR]
MSTTELSSSSLKKLEEEARRAQLARFEKDKALKEKYKKHPPWSAEDWQRAKAAPPRPPVRYPVIISSSGTFPTAEKVKEVANLPSVPEVLWTTMTTMFDSEPEPEEPEKVQYCVLDFDALQLIENYAKGEDVAIWFEGKKRTAWLSPRRPRQKRQPPPGEPPGVFAPAFDDDSSTEG